MILRRICWAVLACSIWCGGVVEAVQKDDLIKQLSNADPRVREEAAIELAKMGKAIVPSLTKIIDNPKTHPDVKVACANCLGLIGPEAEGALKSLKSMVLPPVPPPKGRMPSAAERTAATVAMGKIGKAAYKDLHRYLAEPVKGKKDLRYFDVDTRRLAVEALTIMGAAAKDSAEEFALGLKEKELKPEDKPKVLAFKTACAKALGGLGAEAKKYLKDLAAGADDPDLNFKLACLFAMTRIDPDAAETAGKIKAVLTDPATRGNVANSLVDSGKEGVVLVLSMYEHEDANVRRTCIQTVHNKTAVLARDLVADVAQFLDDSQPDIRVTTVKTLGKATGDGGPAAIARLTLALKDENATVKNDAVTAITALAMANKESRKSVIEALKERDTQVLGQFEIVLLRLNETILPDLREAIENHENSVVRQNAVHFVSKFPQPTAEKAIPSIQKVLKDKNPELRKVASEVLEKLGVTPVKTFALQLKEKDKETRIQAAQSLSELGEKAKEALPELRAALKDTEPSVRGFALSALKNIGPDAKPAIPDIAPLLEDPEMVVLQAALDCLANFGSASAPALPQLEKACQHQEESIRQQAVAAIGRIGVPAIPTLLKLTKDSNKDVRAGAATSLGVLGPPAGQAVAPLIGMLKDPEAEVRSAAALALKEMGPLAKPAHPALIAALQDKEADVREKAAITLGSFGAEAKEAVQPLLDLLLDKEEEPRQAAADALGKMGQPAVAPMIQTLSNPKYAGKDQKRLLLEALGKLGHVAASAAPAILPNLNDKDNDIRLEAIMALGKVNGGVPAVEPLKNILLKDKAQNLRHAAAEALGRIGAPAINALLEAIKSDDKTIRRDAAFGLKHAGGAAAPAAVPLKELMFRDRDDQETLQECDEALRSMGAHALQVWLDILKSEHKTVRNRAFEGLQWIDPGAQQAIPILKEIIAKEKASRDVLESACRLLWSMKSASIPVFLDLLNDPDPYVIHRAIDYLSLLKTQNMATAAQLQVAVEPVRKLTTHANQSVKHSANYFINLMTNP